MINPFSVIITFALILIILDVLKPQASRIILGIFFLIMALGVNLPIILTDPSLFAAAGQNALLPVYRWFFTTVLAAYPLPLALMLLVFETSVGVLILSRGGWVKYGLLGVTLFCLAVTPIGIEEITCPALALAAGLLLRHDFDRSLPDLLAARFHRATAIG